MTTFSSQPSFNGPSAEGPNYIPTDTWSWKLNSLPAETGTLVLNVYPSSTQQESSEGSTEGSAPSSNALDFLLENAHERHGMVKFLLPVISGYVVQSDFIERRMVDCLDVIKVKGFVRPGQHIDGHAATTYQSMELLDLLSYCYGAIVIQNEESPSTMDKSAKVNEELLKRISFPWLLPNPIDRKRLAVVGAGSLSKLKGFAIAAASLNVAVVVFDEPDHWCSGDAYSYLREEFVPLDMTTDANMSQRIATALSTYQNSDADMKHLDGIMTVDEHLLTIVAHAATILGLNTSPPKSVSLAQNKFQTRQLDTNVYCRLVRSVGDLEKLLAEDGPRLQYPLIVKPAKGWSSEGVWRVENELELRTKVAMLWQDAFTAWHGHDVVVETYVNGPEVDANMVLVDGEVVFFEVNDDFPSPGDLGNGEDESPASAPVANFVETSNMLPSALPTSELEALQQRLHELALSAGFRDGVLHMEARLRNSSCHYTNDAEMSNSDGLIDLKLNPSTASTTKPEDVFLLEINPRQPGWQEIEATAHTYGVSYYSLSVLHALADRERIIVLSQPFVGGAQYHMQLLFVSAQRGGIYQSGDICAAVLHRESQTLGRGENLGTHVVECANLMEDGQWVPDPRTGQVYGNFIAFFLVVSRTSRLEAMRIGREIESLVRLHTNGF
ncbi:hypothetical protein F4779DRAFT_634886 [Xylariaceae sp. FL0662B]|nr:hypothetical protein F4779DRAFT_634886 [Xylariaceae sp. FL0662B]